MKSFHSTKAGPLAYAIAGAIMVPFAVVLLILCAFVIVMLWPILPFILYRQRRDELAKERAAWIERYRRCLSPGPETPLS